MQALLNPVFNTWLICFVNKCLLDSNIFHDVRTNEILPFHAFLESISDSFQPDYNASSGYGRIDEVRSYVKTTRNISFNFIIAAMCEEDHDLMQISRHALHAIALKVHDMKTRVLNDLNKLVTK